MRDAVRSAGFHDDLVRMRSVSQHGRRREGGDFDIEEGRRALYRRFNLRELVRLMRRADYLALREFGRRYRRLLRAYCDRADLAVGDFVALAGDVLDDVALQLIESKAPTPESIDNLIITVFKHRFLDEERQVTRRATHEALALESEPDDPERIHRTAFSEGSVRDSVGPLWEPLPLPSGVRRLASMLEEGLSDEERNILAWVSEHRPQTQIAAWLGVSHSAARKRLERLRARLGDIATEYRLSLHGRDRSDVDRFFDRFDRMLRDRTPPPTDGTRAVSNE